MSNNKKHKEGLTKKTREATPREATSETREATPREIETSSHETSINETEETKASREDSETNGNVKVFCRFRPLNSKEEVNGSKKIFRIPSKNKVFIQNGESKNELKFEFDHVFHEHTQQEEVYNVVGKPLVEEVLKGYNATIFAYGQTGCLDPETKVLMFDGKFKKAKDVVIGDLLMGDDSTPRKVLKLFEGEDEMFEVIQSKGKSYKINSSHILTLKKKSFLKMLPDVTVDISLKDFMKQHKTKKQQYRGIQTHIEFPKKEVPIEPYLVGSWIGSGKDVPQFEKRRIPDIYKINDRKTRLSLLAGFIDSNDCETPFSNSETNYKIKIRESESLLIEDFEYLCHSLGFSFYKYSFESGYFICNISGSKLDEIPVCCEKRLNSKIDVLSKKIKIVSCGKGKYNGWTLDGNGRFLLSDFTITHNSGKTSTMTGYSEEKNSDIVLWKDPKDMGVVPRLIRDLFTSIKFKKDHEFCIQISYIEIYLERIRDLLNPLNENLEIRESRYKGIWVENVTENYVSSFDEAIKTMRKGEVNRTVAPTAMNAHSSRSHSVLIMNLHQTNIKSQVKTHSRMIFVDLAGSEKVEKTKAEGINLKEAQATNTSLMTLGVVIRALTTKSPHIPYRDSKLTRLLTDSLGGNSKTHLIVTCSPAIYNIDETISTLRFGNNTQMIKNKPRVNLEMNIEEYKKQLLHANEKIITQQGIIDALQKDLKKICGGNNPQSNEMQLFEKITNETNEPYEETLEKLNILNQELLTKSDIINQLQRAISEAQNRVEEYKDTSEKLSDDLSQLKQEIENKNQDIRVLQLQNDEMSDKIIQFNENLRKLNDLNENNSVLTSENSLLKTRIVQLVDDNRLLRENNLRTWKEKDSSSSSEDNHLEKYSSLIRSEEECKQLLEAKTRHIKVLEDSLRNNNTKIQEIASENKKKCIEYEKTIKDLSSQIRILKNTTPPSNIFNPIKYT